MSPDPAVSYPAGQALARDVLGLGGSGLLYPSARHDDGQCLVALRPHLVQNAGQGDSWKLEWARTSVPSIAKI